MNSLSIALDTGARYRLLDIIRGVTTAGVTLDPTTATRPGQSANVDRLTLQADNANGGNIISYGDASIPTTGLGGLQMLAGDVEMFQGTPCPTLDFYIAVTVNGTKLRVAWN